MPGSTPAMSSASRTNGERVSTAAPAEALGACFGGCFGSFLGSRATLVMTATCATARAAASYKGIPP